MSLKKIEAKYTPVLNKGNNILISTAKAPKIMSTEDIEKATAMPLENFYNDLNEKNEKNKKNLINEFRKKNAEKLLQIKSADVSDIAYGIYSSEEIEKLAVVECNNPSDFGSNTVRDSRLGPHNRNERCGTCQNDYINCPGHHGYIKLKKLFHPLALTTIQKVRDCVCANCSALLISNEQFIDQGFDKLPQAKRLTAMVEFIRNSKITCKRKTTKKKAKSCHEYGYVKRTWLSKSKMVGNYKIGYRIQSQGSIYYDLPEEVYTIFDNISESEAVMLGFTNGNHPRNLIIDRLLVIPYCARPDLMQGEIFNPDSFSYSYSQIIKLSNQLNNVNENQNQIENHKNELFNKITALMKSDPNIVNQGSKKIMDFKSRIQGKYGMIRSYIMGKRVDFAGRTVAGPGPDLRVDQCAISKDMANKLSIPVQATIYNIEELQKDYDENRILYITTSSDLSGVRKVVSRKFREEWEKKQKGGYKINIGDTVERVLKDGDIVLINRQPTLHKQSILALYAIIMNDKTVKINLSITPSLNADFDGDELNIHVPQTPEARAEAIELLTPQACLMNEGSNKPIIALTYDSILGVYLMTINKEKEMALFEFDQTILDQQLKYENLLESNPEIKTEYDEYILNIKNEKKELTEKYDQYQETADLDYIKCINDLENYILNYKGSDIHNDSEYKKLFENKKILAERVGIIDEITFTNAINTVINTPQYATLMDRLKLYNVPLMSTRALLSASFPENFYYRNSNIFINNGIFIKGVLTKEDLGQTQNNIIAEMYKQLGPNKTIDFLSNIQFIIREYLKTYGFTVSIVECLPDNKDFFRKVSKETISKAEFNIFTLQTKTKNKFELMKQELKISEILDLTKSFIDDLVARTTNPLNNFMIMSKSGAKGSITNFTQISSLLGQQRVDEERIPNNLPGNRSLPIYELGDDSPETRGFVKESFYEGLSMPGYFNHSQSARENLTDTAVNTARTGDLQHNLIKACEDIHVSGDSSVRNGDSAVVQFIYGEDGFNPGKVSKFNIAGKSKTMFRNLNLVAEKLNHNFALKYSISNP